MKKFHKSTPEEVVQFLKKIEERMKLNNKFKSWNAKEEKPSL